jgi:hypothetical protein
MYLSFFIGALILAIGKTTLLEGVVHLIIFFEFLFLSLVFNQADTLIKGIPERIECPILDGIKLSP